MEILFVCTGNTCRSAMAEVIAKKVFDKENISAKISSAGISAQISSPATENAILSVAEIGLDLEGHSSRQVEIQMLVDATLILTMTENHKLMILYMSKQLGYDFSYKTFTIAQYAGEEERDIPDPFYQNIEAYNKCRDEIEILIRKIAKGCLNDSNWK